MAKDEGLAAYHRLRDALHSEALVIQLGGELPVYAETREQLERDLRKAEVYSFPLLAILLVWVFGSLVAAALPLLVGAASMVMSLALLKLAAQFTEVTVYAANVVSMLGLGLAIDYSLFIVSRYREEMVRKGELTMSLCTTLMTAGRTVAYSGLTVAISLFCLLLLPQRFFQNMGLAGGLSVVAAMLTSVVLLFQFDSDRNDRAQFLRMSMGGFVDSALVIALLIAVLPLSAMSGKIAMFLVVLGVVATFILEVPVAWRVARGAPIPRGAAYRSSVEDITAPTPLR